MKIMQIHKEIKSISSLEEKQKVEQELLDRFGKLTDEIKQYINKQYMESLSKKIGIESITIKKARKIICSSSTQKQSLINRIFLGRIEYLENSFWTTTVEMTPFGDQIFIKEVINSSAKSTTNNTYRIGGNISSINGPKNPLVIKHNNSQMTAKVIVGG